MRRRLRLKCDGTRAETRFCLSAKRTSPFKSTGESVQSTTGSRGVRISGSILDTRSSEVVWMVLAIHSIRQFPLNFPSRALPCAITFQLDTTTLFQLRGSGGLCLKEKRPDREDVTKWTNLTWTNEHSDRSRSVRCKTVSSPILHILLAVHRDILA